MEQIDRDIAKDKIVAERFTFLRDSDKLRIIETHGYLFDGLLNDVTLINNDEDLTLSFSTELDPIFRQVLKEELHGVTNEYLEIILNRNQDLFIVIGTVEQMGECPCCNHFSIGYGTDGFHDICSVCFWQNGGSGPNSGMLIEEARANFNNYGAMTKSSLRYIDPEGIIKYGKAE